MLGNTAFTTGCTTGQSAIEDAFSKAKQSSAVTEISQDLKNGLGAWWMSTNRSRGQAKKSAAADAAQAIDQVNDIIREMSEIASTVSVTVEVQNVAFADGVNRASLEAQGGADAMSRVAGSTASDVKAMADALGHEAENLEAEVQRFLTEIQAAWLQIRFPICDRP